MAPTGGLTPTPTRSLSTTRSKPRSTEPAAAPEPGWVWFPPKQVLLPPWPSCRCPATPRHPRRPPLHRKTFPRNNLYLLSLLISSSTYTKHRCPTRRSMKPTAGWQLSRVNLTRGTPYALLPSVYPASRQDSTTSASILQPPVLVSSMLLFVRTQ